MPVISFQEFQQLSPMLRGRLGTRLARAAMRICAIDKVNELNDRNDDWKGTLFARSMLEDLKVEYMIGHPEILDNLPEGAFISISNHPYGGMDGIIMMDMLGHVRPEIKFMVNKLLYMIKPLQENEIAVDPTGAQRTGATATSIAGTREALMQLRAGRPLGILPSGAVSDLHIWKGFKIYDREWQEAAIKLIQKARVPILPFKYLDHNSLLFYIFGMIDWRVRVLRLPHELFNKHKKPQRVVIGDLISVEEQEQYKDLDSFRAFIRSRVYDLKEPAEMLSGTEWAARHPLDPEDFRFYPDY